MKRGGRSAFVSENDRCFECSRYAKLIEKKRGKLCPSCAKEEDRGVVRGKRRRGGSYDDINLDGLDWRKAMKT